VRIFGRPEVRRPSRIGLALAAAAAVVACAAPQRSPVMAVPANRLILSVVDDVRLEIDLVARES